MYNTATIFGRKTSIALPKNPPTKSQQNPQQKKRKTRSDKKHDIKFKLKEDDIKTLKREGLKYNLKITPFTTELVKQELNKSHEYINDYLYDNNEGSFVHVMLENDYFKIVQNLSIEWNLPYRKVVYRIVKEYLNRISGIKIRSYNEGDNKW